jgi:tripartite ATP-independent transporter DctM subunit
MVALALMATLLVGMFIGLPIVLAIGGATLVHVADSGPRILQVFMQRLFAGITNYNFAAVPLFILAGALMTGTGITDRLLRFCNALVGHVRGALAQVNVVASIFFAGISGSALADTAALGSVLIPAMEKDGYEKGFAGAVTAASATIGPIIPPSIVMVVYASTFELSIGAMFAAGILPGVGLGISQMIITYWISVRRGYPSKSTPTLGQFVREFGRSLLGAWSALLVPLIILGGIFGGVFTATEAAAVAALYSVVVGTAVYRQVSWKKLYFMFRDAALTTAGILMILAVAQNFAWVITRRKMPSMIMEQLLGLTQEPFIMMLLIMFSLLVIGMFVERIVALFILTPILLPVMTMQLGMSELHAGMTLVFALGVGHITPPFGGTLYTAAMVGGTTVEEIVRFLLPYIIGMIIMALLVMFIPSFVTAVPEALGFTLR